MKPIDVEVLALKGICGDAEVDVAGALATIDESGVTLQDFTNSQTQAVFAAIGDKLRAGNKPEVVSLTRAVSNRAPRELVFDVVVNRELGVSRQRLAVIRERSQRASLVESLRSLTAMVEGAGITLEAAIGEAQRVLQTLQGPKTIQSSEGDLMELINRLEATQRGEFEPVVPTGIEALDFMTGGLQKTLTVIGAMPGVGKSTLLATIVKNLAMRGERVGLLSLEDSREWLSERLLAEASAVPLFVLGNKPLTQGQLERVGEASERVFADLKNIIIDDTHGMNCAEVVASARRMVAMGCKAILVDHLGEVRVERSERHDLDIAEVLQSLRGIAKTYKVPVVVACHLRRREGLNVTTEPKLSDFAFSASIERMSRVALGLYKGDDGELAVAVLKQTRGPSGASFVLNVNKLYATVAKTEVTHAMRQAYGGWRDS